MSGTIKVIRHNEQITYYGCTDCGLVDVNAIKRNQSLRPNCKFCDKDCMAYVLENAEKFELFRRPYGWKDWLKQHDETKASNIKLTSGAAAESETKK